MRVQIQSLLGLTSSTFRYDFRYRIDYRLYLFRNDDFFLFSLFLCLLLIFFIIFINKIWYNDFTRFLHYIYDISCIFRIIVITTITATVPTWVRIIIWLSTRLIRLFLFFFSRLYSRVHIKYISYALHTLFILLFSHFLFFLFYWCIT